MISLVSDARESYGVQTPGELAERERRALLRDAARTIEQMPLWKLQVIGNQVVPFLYENAGDACEITLHEGVAYCLRRFHSLVRGLVQDAWIRFIRNLRGNREILGESADLSAFLFGSERAGLFEYIAILRETQKGLCFYCEARLHGHEVDHFIPWSRYPCDLGHNFVLACKACNNDKRDHLAAPPHLERWMRRNPDHGDTLRDYFARRKLAHNLAGSMQITRWAYRQADQAGATVWLARDRIVLLDPEWKSVLGECA
jgi:5-methylcytosine-specific restriction endonuclease McrA